MKNALVTFRSVTPEQRAEMLLRRNGYYCALRRTPRWMQDKGCGYSLMIRTIDMDDCLRTLNEDAVEFKKVYLLLDNGGVEEVKI